MRTPAALATVAIIISGCSNAAEEAVRQELIDPSSAEFRKVEACSGDSSITRGEVNGKNRVGAYTGFEPFFVEFGIVHFVASPRFTDTMNRCYADISAVAAHADSEASTAGDWYTNEDRDPIDDSAVITAMLDAESGSSSYGDVVSLVARCGSNTTEVYAVWHDYVGDDSSSVYNEFKNVEVRVGEADAETQQWSVSSDKKATFASAPVPLLKRMVAEDRLALRMTPYGESPITAIFDLDGMREAVEPLAEECGWQL